MTSNNVSPLPNNSENYYRLGINKIIQGDRTSAIAHFEKSFAIDNNMAAFQELVKLYSEGGRQYDLAKLWQESGFDFTTIARSDQLIILYSESIPVMSPDSRKLNELYELVFASQDSNTRHVVEHNIAILREILDIKHFLQEEPDQDTLTNFINQLILPTAYPLLNKLKFCYRLDISLTEVLYTAILGHSTIPNYIKNDIIHYFINQEYDIKLPYVWFNKRMVLETKQLTSYTKDDFVILGIQHIYDHFSKEDPQYLDDFLMQFRLHALCYYPFFDHVKMSPSDWLILAREQAGLPLTSDESNRRNLISDEFFNLASGELAQIFFDNNSFH